MGRDGHSCAAIGSSGIAALAAAAKMQSRLVKCMCARNTSNMDRELAPGHNCPQDMQDMKDRHQ
jgi:hypothetical protein